MKINQQQLDAVIALPSDERYKYFVKKVADWQVVWGLYQSGWALAATDDGTVVFPLWPAMEFAQACAREEWAGYEPRSISLEDFTNMLLPKLKADSMLAGIFFIPKGKGITPSADQLKEALDSELQNY